MRREPVTFKDLDDLEVRTCNRFISIQDRLEKLEKHEDDMKVWLEGFKEGFMVRNKKEKKK